MKRVIFLLSLLILMFNITYTEEEDIEEILYKQWSFSVKDESVYYGKQKISNLDYLSFEKLNDYYVRDKNGIYGIIRTVVVTGWETLAVDDNFKNENWYEDKEIDQWYSLEIEAEKIPQINRENYILDGQYIFGSGYGANRGKIIYLKKNVPFKVDMKTLKIVDNNISDCDDNNLECNFYRNILLKDKNGVYGLADTDDETEVYKIKNVDISSFEKTGIRLYKDKNKGYNAEDLEKRLVRMRRN